MKSVGYDGIVFELVDKNGEPVNTGDTITTFRGETAILESARAPHKPSSVGHVNNFYASVYGLKWIEV